MWVTPEAMQKIISKDLFWQIIKQSDIFQILKYKTTGHSLLDGFISTIRSVNPLEKQPLKFRLILNFEEKSFTLAVSDSEEVILKHWNILLNEIIPQIHSLKEPMQSETNTGNENSIGTNNSNINSSNNNNNNNKNNNNNNSHSFVYEKEIVEYILSKVSSLAQLEEGEPTKNVETVIKDFHSQFTQPELEKEKLITFYRCTIWVSYPRQGIVYITEKYICFYSASMKEKLVIPFRDIINISKETVALGFLDNSIRIATRSNEYSFAFLKRQEVYVILERLWKNVMHKVLHSAEESVENSTVFKQVDSYSKKVLDDNLRNESFQKLFRVYEEKLINDFLCSYWYKESYIVGQLYISAHFICFESNFTLSGKVLKFVIPMNSVEKCEKEKVSFGLSNGLSIKTKDKGNFFLALYSRNEAYDLIDKLWQTKPSSPEPHEPVNNWALDTEYLRSIDPIEEKAQKTAWETYFKKNGSGPCMLRKRKLEKLLRYPGLPDELRGKMWQTASGSYYRYQVQKGYYANLLKHFENSKSEALEEIEKDISRSLPNHPYFQDSNGIGQLRNVLTAFSWRNPRIGYCQSMNILAATFLLYMTEEEAFWLLCTVVEEIVPEYYNKSLLGSQVDQYVFKSLVENNLPRIYQHLEEVNLPLNIISLPWFMCLFVTYIPWKASLRLLDWFFHDGSDVLLQVGLAIFKLNEKEILQERDTERIINLLKETNAGNLLIHTAFVDFGFLPIERIQEIRNRQKFQTIREIEASKKRRMLLQIIDKKSTKFDMHELEAIFDKFQALISSDSIDYATDMEHAQQLFQIVLSPIQGPWYNYVLPQIFVLWGSDSSSSASLISFANLVLILSVALKGNLKEQATLCFQLCDNDKDGCLNYLEVSKFLKVLYMMNIKEEEKTFDEFGEMLFSLVQKRKDKDLISLDEFIEVAITKPLLASYWKLDPTAN